MMYFAHEDIFPLYRQILPTGKDIEDLLMDELMSYSIAVNLSNRVICDSNLSEEIFAFRDMYHALLEIEYILNPKDTIDLPTYLVYQSSKELWSNLSVQQKTDYVSNSVIALIQRGHVIDADKLKSIRQYCELNN